MPEPSGSHSIFKDTATSGSGSDEMRQDLSSVTRDYEMLGNWMRDLQVLGCFAFVVFPAGQPSIPMLRLSPGRQRPSLRCCAKAAEAHQELSRTDQRRARCHCSGLGSHESASYYYYCMYTAWMDVGNAADYALEAPIGRSGQIV
ncbi:hypothetical protein AXG93_197s1020 [Marchantia polymorpha subsp. ruderalis]|uniref:Uncharacterized protein n=1 Tax=Marchantia polymorpha subsp. ruderalis TaxID=1480154 RepID=A0A176VZB7_MARPO|nr:hypothetical protein AXG93_197s1020 [Marchantia polymorpha subsp. ruderalis]